MAGSLGYAEKLKNKKRLGGQLGAQEFFEEVQHVKEKVQELADMILGPKDVFFFTGAGISTSVGIPDFRGPTGIWTLKKKKQPITAPLTPFEHAKPSFTHMAIAALVASGKASMVCSQNVDSLHLRSGVPRDKMAELHGNCFAERCSVCKTERVRDFQVETLNFRPTGRVCSRPGCGGPMQDNVLDWDSPLPDDELDASIAAAETAGVCLVLGSSLQIAPANEIPLFTADAKGKMVIINLQKTPRDRRAALIIRARVDPVIALLCLKLGLTIPPYVRMDAVAVCHSAAALPVKQEQKEGLAGEGEGAGQLVGQQGCQVVGDDKSLGWGFELMVRSVHGESCMMPMVKAVSVIVKAREHGGGESKAATPHIRALPPRNHQPPSKNGSRNENESVQGPGQQSGDDASAVQRAEGDVGVGWVLLGSVLTPNITGGVPTGGGYQFSIRDIPWTTSSVTCTVQLGLVEWADADKQLVTLPEHVVTRDSVAQACAGSFPTDADVAAVLDAAQLALPCQAPHATLVELGLLPPAVAQPKQESHTVKPDADSKDAVDQETGQVKQEQQGLPDQGNPAGAGGQAVGPHPQCISASTRLSVHTYLTQQVNYDAQAVWDAYEQAPPPVVLPVKRSKVSKESSASAIDPASLRRSSRRAGQPRGRAAASAGDYAWGSEGDDDDEEDDDWQHSEWAGPCAPLFDW